MSITFYDLLGIDPGAADPDAAAAALWPNDIINATEGVNVADDRVRIVKWLQSAATFERVRPGADKDVALGAPGAPVGQITVAADLRITTYLGLLKPLGAMVNVGIPTNAYDVAPFALVGGSKTLAGSNIGGIPATQDMLDFCAEHGIGATVETISGDQLDEAWDRVVGSDVRYRFVIDTATF